MKDANIQKKAAHPPPAAKSISELRDRIKVARDKWDEIAMKEQTSVLRFGKYNAVLIPIAVLLLTVQILAFSANLPIAIFLIALELIILSISIFVLFAEIGPNPKGWAEARMRAEIFRREDFLLLTRVGPYLERETIHDLEAVVNVQLRKIDTPDSDPMDYIRLQDSHDSPEISWRDMLEDTKKSASPEPESLDEYLRDRLNNQQEWYSRKTVERYKTNAWFEHVTRGVLIAALVLASMHLIALISAPTKLKLLIEILAITLPAVGAAFGSLQAFFQYRRISRTYDFYSRALNCCAGVMTALQGQTHHMEKGLYLKNFKRLVLKTEELLASELYQWYFFIQ